MNRKIVTLAVAVISLSLFLTACQKEDSPPAVNNEEELITTVKLKIKETGAIDPEEFIWEDLDGEGGKAPDFDTISLKANKTYEVEVEFLDESKTPAEDITEEIKEEEDEHEVFYIKSKNLPLLIYTTDFDAEQRPLGLQSEWITTKPTTGGSVKVVLKHKPGIKNFNDDVTKGESDIEVSFPLIVK
jgi:hypothetical protein